MKKTFFLSIVTLISLFLMDVAFPQVPPPPVTTATHAQNIPSDLATQSATAPSPAQFTVTNGDINAALQPGSDIGAKVNAAISNSTLCLSSAYPQCIIYVPSGNYNFSTTISIPVPTINFPSSFELKCSPGAVLNYTGSGDAIAVNGTGSAAPDVKITSCHIIGTASAVSGIHLVKTYGYILDHPTIEGFSNPAAGKGDAIWIDGSGVGTIIHPSIHAPNNCFWVTTNHVNGGFAPNNNTIQGGNCQDANFGWNNQDTSIFADGNILFGVAFAINKNHIFDAVSRNFTIIGCYFEASSNPAISLGLGAPITSSFSPFIEGNNINSNASASSISLTNVANAMVVANREIGRSSVFVTQGPSSANNTVQNQDYYSNTYRGMPGMPVILVPGAGATTALCATDPSNSACELSVDTSGNTVVHGIMNSIGGYSANGTAGVTKKCTVMPTVKNGIITAC